MIRGELGGFVHVGKHNDRLDLQEILAKFEHIDQSRDKYTDIERETFKPIVTYMDDVERS
jgi:hypothetical protein